MDKSSPDKKKMITSVKHLLALALMSGLLIGNLAAQPLPPGKSDFAFTDARSNPDKPLTAWYYKPATATRDSRVIFVMTGVKRNAEVYRNNWIRHADKHNFILVVPEFPRRYYNKSDDYTFGGVTESDPEKWGFRTLEHLFDEIRQREGLSAEKYSIYGHSAGAQFTHRLMLFTGASARVDTAVAANAGWYTLPLYTSDPLFKFPLTITPESVPESALPRIYANRLFILLGDQDTDIRHKDLNRTPPAMAQGEHRLARGHYFYRAAKAQAAALDLPFNWTLVVVPGVAHSDKGMSEAAMKVFFAAR